MGDDRLEGRSGAYKFVREAIELTIVAIGEDQMLVGVVQRHGVAHVFQRDHER